MPKVSGVTWKPFSAYARQFLDRMDRPAVDKVDGVPAAIAIDQTNPVRSSRSTVGTMTELNDHLKLLFARAAQLFDKQTAEAVKHDTPQTIFAQLEALSVGDPRWVITFPVELPANTSAEELQAWLSASGFSRVHTQRSGKAKDDPQVLDVVADRFRAAKRRTFAGDGSHRSGIAAWQWPYDGLPHGSRRGCRVPRRDLWFFNRTALPDQRCALQRPHAVDVFIQLARRCLSCLSGFWPRHWRGLWLGHSQRQAHTRAWVRSSPFKHRLGKNAKTI
jgi:hypothetical protein